MLQVSRRPAALAALTLLLAALALVGSATTARAQNDPDKAKEEPPFHAYKGVKIGMTADEARKLLGNPTDKDDKQDFYSFNDKESCQVYYDDAKKVFAVSVTYLATDAAPVPKNVLGADADAKQDGSLYKMIRFPKVGYWVSYTRTSGNEPMTIIAIQKIQ
jgi:hypothetical protein